MTDQSNRWTLVSLLHKFKIGCGIALSCLAALGFAYSSPDYHYTHQDPFRSFNKAMFEFNQVFSGLFIKPWAYLYTHAVWSPIQHSIHRFYMNLGSITTIPNDLLQAKLGYFFNDTWRFIINSTLGVGGLFDVASHIGLKSHATDFGQTLAVWGIHQSPYIVLPILGPSTLRDAFAKPWDTFLMSAWPYIRPNSLSYGLYAGNLLVTQAQLLPAYRAIDQAFSPYVFLRDVYLQNRDAAIAHNNLPYQQE